MSKVSDFQMYRYRKLNPQERKELLEYRKQRGYPLHSPPHPVLNQPYYLITAACYEHKHRLNTSERRQQLFNAVSECLMGHQVEIHAWVVLPNHYHLLTTTIDFKWFSREIRLIHGRFARQWNQDDQQQGKLWCSYSDRAIRNEKHYYTALNYIHYNPVKHKHVESPYDWLDSSVHDYLENKGRDWLRQSWQDYSIKNYDDTWDQ
jgi:putative transposase